MGRRDTAVRGSIETMRSRECCNEEPSGRDMLQWCVYTGVQEYNPTRERTAQHGRRLQPVPAARLQSRTRECEHESREGRSEMTGSRETAGGELADTGIGRQEATPEAR